MTEVRFSPRALSRFVEVLSAEIGRDALKAILSQSALPEEWSRPAYFLKMEPPRAARAYAQLQAALRLYYGRGARGILFRVGSKLWRFLLRDAALGYKARAALLRLLPASLRRKPALDLLAGMWSGSRGDLSAHTHDLELILVDRACPAALDQVSATPICFVTLGLIRECLFWADGREYDMEETACRAAGAHQCEFKIKPGG